MKKIGETNGMADQEDELADVRGKCFETLPDDGIS
jgi:hypothetical protein